MSPSDQPTDAESALLQMSWYLDTSLFWDFVAKNVRKGFDESEPFDGHTLVHVKCAATKTQTFVPLFVNGLRCAFELTETVDRLRCIQMTHNLQYVVSDLTKAEIYRSLRKAHPTRPAEQIENWWSVLRHILSLVELPMSPLKSGGELSRLALEFPINKNVQDYIHLVLARQGELAFITSDKLDGKAESLRQSYYPHIYYWPDLKSRVPVDEIFTT